ncbi:MAG: ABC transporter substrate-binding protein [Chloroflexi bacterium]|nr:ABC transporter substrate-binding protein [Chloroflexota bacterium]
MANLALTMACGPYDRTDGLRTGNVRPEGIDLTYLPIQSPPEIFARMTNKQSFDLSEMSCSLYLTLRTRGDFPFVALPVFPSRLFRHGFIFVNANAGIRAPKDLEGKRVGVPEYRQTAAVWIRGILHQYYGVAQETLHWHVGGVNAPRGPDGQDVVMPNRTLKVDFIGGQRTLNEMLASGEIDAMIGARQPAALGKQPQVQRLFPDYRAEERRFYQETGVFPIMHTLVMKEALYQRHPWIVESIFKAWEESQAECIQQMRFSGTLRYTLPWLFADLEEIDGLFGGNPFPQGLEPNRKTLATLQRYLLDQGFIEEARPLEDLFTPIVLANE